MREVYDDETEQHRNEHDAWEKQRHQILSDKAVYPNKASKQAALAEIGKEPEPPLTPMLLAPEPTYEGLVRLLREGQPAIGVFSNEGGRFVGSHAMNAENRLKTSAAFSELWDGQPIRRTRQGDGSFVLHGRRVSTHLMLQPGVASLLLSDPMLNDQGILTRFLVVYPETTAGTRFQRDANPEGDAAIRRYGARLLDMLETDLPLAEEQRNELEPRPLPLAADATLVWTKFADHIEARLAPGGDLEPIREFASKVAEHAARLAAVLALVDDIDAPSVPGDAMARGVMLAQHYLSEMLRLEAAGLTTPDIALAERLLAWLHERWTERMVSVVDIYQRGPATIRDKKGARRIVDILEDHGWLEPVAEGQLSPANSGATCGAW